MQQVSKTAAYSGFQIDMYQFRLRPIAEARRSRTRGFAIAPCCGPLSLLRPGRIKCPGCGRLRPMRSGSSTRAARAPSAARHRTAKLSHYRRALTPPTSDFNPIAGVTAPCCRPSWLRWKFRSRRTWSRTSARGGADHADASIAARPPTKGERGYFLYMYNTFE